MVAKFHWLFSRSVRGVLTTDDNKYTSDHPKSYSEIEVTFFKVFYEIQYKSFIYNL